MLEIGTWKGVTIADFATRRGDATFLCIDPFPKESPAIMCWRRNTRGLPNVTAFIGTVEEWLAWNNRPEKFDLILVDGEHYYEPCKTDLIAASKLVRPGGIILVHDYTCLCFGCIRQAVADVFGGPTRVIFTTAVIEDR